MGVPTMDQQWLNTYREEIGGFSNTIHSFAQGEIARKDYKGISGGFGSYAQRDAAKHMLRLRLPGGRVTPERLHFMAQAVQQYHVPFLKLTTCEAIQMHDLTPDEVPAIMEAAIPCGISKINVFTDVILAAKRAIDSANLAHMLVGTRTISFDMVVRTMYETGISMNRRFRETAEGGLAKMFQRRKR